MENTPTVYVMMNDKGDVIRYSTIPGTGIAVIQDDPIININKLIGYKVEVGDDRKKHLIFDEEKYNNYVTAKIKEEAIQEANVKLEELAKSNILPSLSDEDAYELRMLYPEFEIGVDYKVGERIIYQDKFYKVLLDHTSQEDWTPDIAVSLFVEISDPAVEYPEFVQPTNAETAYMKDDKVTFEGNKYICLIDNNVYSPTDYPAGWQLVE
ncbi:MAG: carbohydrate-binding protein [Candidatus Coprovivens sp.]